MSSVLAKREAKDLGFDEAILLDHQGFVAEGSGENIFIVRNDKILTPSLAAQSSAASRATARSTSRALSASR